MTWKKLLEQIEALEEGLENMPPEVWNTAHFARIELADSVARAREILEALAHDEAKRKDKDGNDDEQSNG